MKVKLPLGQSASAFRLNGISAVPLWRPSANRAGGYRLQGLPVFLPSRSGATFTPDGGDSAAGPVIIIGRRCPCQEPREFNRLEI